MSRGAVYHATREPLVGRSDRLPATANERVLVSRLQLEIEEREARAAAMRFCSRCRRQFDSRGHRGCPVCAAFARGELAPPGTL